MNILAIGSHPDDIEYGCGGTLIKFNQAGHNVFLFLATDGRLGGVPEERRREQLRSGRIMGTQRIFWGEYEDTRVPVAPETIERIERVIRDIKPQYLFVHFPDDTHQDHRAISKCALSAGRYVPNFLFYEGPTTQNFNPTIFVDIKEVLEAKIELLRAHASQVSRTNIVDLTILESAKSNVNFRGIQGRVKYAEAFVSQRMLIDIPNNGNHSTLTTLA
ncbi:MAG: PIG-L deacetylase family protein [bacterium]